MRARLRLRRSDVAGLAERAPGALEAALGVVAENALADTEEYVPYETGALVGSGQTRASGRRASLMWGTDGDAAEYARPQYYEPHDHSTDANAAHSPRATDHWAEASARENKGRWRDMLAHELGEAIS